MFFSPVSVFQDLTEGEGLPASSSTTSAASRSCSSSIPRTPDCSGGSCRADGELVAGVTTHNPYWCWEGQAASAWCITRPSLAATPSTIRSEEELQAAGAVDGKMCRVSLKKVCLFGISPQPQAQRFDSQSHKYSIFSGHPVVEAVSSPCDMLRWWQIYYSYSYDSWGSMLLNVHCFIRNIIRKHAFKF